MGEPTHAGLVYFRRSGRLWWSFTCDAHVDLLQAPRPLIDRDRAELARRREKHRLVIDEHQPDVPDEPLATGAEARELLARAQD